MLDVTYVHQTVSLPVLINDNSRNRNLDIVYHWFNCRNRNAFIEILSSLPYENIELVGVDQWQGAAYLLIALCRFKNTGVYILSDQTCKNSKSFLYDSSPDYILGDVKLDKDPGCAVAECGICLPLH